MKYPPVDPGRFLTVQATKPTATFEQVVAEWIGQRYSDSS